MRLELLIILIGILAMGCNADPRGRRETALLRAEILDLEDKYYILKSQHAETTSELDRLRGHGGTSEIILGEGEVIYGTPVYSDPVGPGSSPSVAPTGNGNGSYDLEIISPLNSMPTEPSPDNSLPDTARISSYPSSATRNSRQYNLAPSQPRGPITGVVIHPRESYGHDVDGIPGDEGLNLLVQPQTVRGIPLLQAGELTVSVIDPAEPADNQRIGLWKFLPEETELFFTDADASTPGILLHLPWDQSTPTGDQLTVFVRFTTPAGQQFETSSEIQITPPRTSYSPDDPLIAGWTQREPRWTDQFRSGPSRKMIEASPVSSGRNRIQKPRWRPVR